MNGAWRVPRPLCASVASLLWLASWGCTEPARVFEIAVRARTEGEPMPGVQISEGGLFLGETDLGGQIHLVTERPEGSEVGLVARCPEGYRARPEELTRTLRAWERASEPAPPLDVEFSCERRVSTLVVVVDTGRSGLPVRVNGQEVARTSESGVAHVIVRDAAGARVVVSVDTVAHPDLAPQSPERAFTIEHDDVVYWQRGFEVPAPEPESPRRRRGSRRGGTTTRPHGPVRVR